MTDNDGCRSLVRLHWAELEGDDDPRWRYQRAVYAYLTPRTREILYIGKCDGTTIRDRWRYDAKSRAWEHINEVRGLKHHHVIVADIEIPDGGRLTRELLADVESLLIYQVQPCVNQQCRVSRISRPNLEVRCCGAWPLRNRTFRDQ